MQAIHEILPFEIMSTIFRHVPESNDDLRTIQKLGEVSSVWKEISQATPELWTFYCLSFPANGVAAELRLNHAYQWLSRSKALPCELEIYTPPALPFQLYQSHLGPLLAFVAKRLSTFRFAGRLGDFEGLFQNLPPSFPELRSLTFFPYGLRSPLNVYPRAFRDSKHLEKFMVTGKLFGSLESVKETISVERLTELVIEGRDIQPQLAYTVFCAATNLVRCTILVEHIGRHDLQNPASISGVSHAHLQDLTLGYFSTWFAAFMEPFQFPSLTKLKIHGESKAIRRRFFSDTSIAEMLLELHGRQPFSLDVLELRDADLDVDEFMDFLELMTMLTELRVVKVDNPAYFQSRIRRMTQGGNPILPELKVVTVS